LDDRATLGARLAKCMAISAVRHKSMNTLHRTPLPAAPAHDDSCSRRTFLADSARAVAAGWLAAGSLAALAACAREDERRGGPFAHLTADEGSAMRAFAARILPSDDGAPGAEEAAAARFVDRALGTPYFAGALPLLRQGLADLDRRARRLGARGGFAALDPARQDAVIRAVERTAFFEAARTLVLTGTFADPSYGGNAGGTGWALVEMEHRATYRAPFGWYDAQAAVDGVA
jgi:gluconate 2-dehydrogenase gamma chain